MSSGGSTFSFNNQSSSRPSLTNTNPVNPNLPNMTHCQLEEMINKWTRELDELEKCFTEEATRMNERDQQLVANGDKIAALHDKIEQCIADQTVLDQELQLFEEQQNELEATTDALEAELQQSALTAVAMTTGASGARLVGVHAASAGDRDREGIFALAEHCQIELDAILGDVRQMVTRINRDNRLGLGDATGDSRIEGLAGGAAEMSGDVIGQVTRILNAHIQSLNWIHQKTNDLMNKLNNMQLS